MNDYDFSTTRFYLHVLSTCYNVYNSNTQDGAFSLDIHCISNGFEIKNFYLQYIVSEIL